LHKRMETNSYSVFESQEDADTIEKELI
jgi:hypothetical protein